MDNLIIICDLCGEKLEVISTSNVATHTVIIVEPCGDGAAH